MRKTHILVFCLCIFATTALSAKPISRRALRSWQPVKDGSIAEAAPVEKWQDGSVVEWSDEEYIQEAPLEPMQEHTFLTHDKEPYVPPCPCRYDRPVCEPWAPQWLARNDFMLDLQEGRKPTWIWDSVFPLVQTQCTARHTWFWQSRWAYRNDDATYNNGLGYRYLFPNQCWMVGVNTFWDFTRKRWHHRASVGGELFCPLGVVRGNYYWALTGTKTIDIDNGVTFREAALDGWDVEGEMQMPFFPWLSILGNGFVWEGRTLKDKKGYQVSAIAHLCDYVSLEGGYIDHNYIRDPEAFIRIECHLGRPKRIQYTLWCTPYCCSLFTPYNLKCRALEKVRRENNMVIEKTQTGGAGIIIGRGT
jgi:hypothetical protein